MTMREFAEQGNCYRLRSALFDAISARLTCQSRVGDEILIPSFPDLGDCAESTSPEWPPTFPVLPLSQDADDSLPVLPKLFQHLMIAPFRNGECNLRH